MCKSSQISPASLILEPVRPTIVEITIGSLVMRFVLAVVCTASFLVGCATQGKYKKVVESWVGSNADSLVSSWGPPQLAYPLSDGGHVLEYSQQQTGQVGGYSYTTPETTYYNGTSNSNSSARAYGNNGNSASAYGYGNSSYRGSSTRYVTKTTPVRTVTYSCSTRFTTNARGVIVNWSFQGNGCKTE